MTTANYPEYQDPYASGNVTVPSTHGYPTQGHATSQQQYILVVDAPEEQIIIEDLDEMTGFRHKPTRMSFVRKVLGLVAFQLIACTGFMALAFLNGDLKSFLMSTAGMSLSIVCLLAWMGLFIAVGCCKVGRGKPNGLNVSLFIISTALLSIYSASIVIYFEIPDIMIAAATTVGVVTLLVLITMLTKIDITGYMIYILGACLALFLFAFISSLLFGLGVIPYEKRLLLQTIITGLFAVLFAIMILYDLKLIVGGGRGGQYGEQDWLIASISLFYDILMFFLQILQLGELSR
ncbi:Transmembrane BAX inhibitor motif-containing protein 4 [Orchesella cincta]|uniref:Transmembrane BAX inhibitor motif-containing protein 4 n=1 Tax=Orchesella cincta TaxID=48709 RepID=A0A1D2MC62_ORCCI|nr:Transmembrane BAX inhibitor motif-containing protein 4 [Orchesella cincta]